MKQIINQFLETAILTSASKEDYNTRAKCFVRTFFPAEDMATDDKVYDFLYTEVGRPEFAPNSITM